MCIRDSTDTDTDTDADADADSGCLIFLCENVGDMRGYPTTSTVLLSKNKLTTQKKQRHIMMPTME